MRRPAWLILLKVLFALLAWAAVVTEIVALSERGRLDVFNLFSFFTIQSNLLGIAGLLLGACSRSEGAARDLVDWFRGGATLMMVITGIVFSVLLSGLEDVELTAVAWDNVVLHYVMPAVLLADWLIDRPDRPLPLKRALWWLVFPLAYLAYTLIRGPIVDWYPYPFLNADTKGYGSIALTSLVIAAFAVGLTWLLVWSTRWGRDPQPASAGSTRST